MTNTIGYIILDTFDLAQITPILDNEGNTLIYPLRKDAVQ